MLKQKQETFTQNLFKGMSQRDAYTAAGYSSNQLPATLDRHAYDLAKNGKILARLEELRQKVEDASVATVLERQQVLTEIVRARQTDYMICSADGVWMHDIGQDTINKAALKQIQTTTMPFGEKEDNYKIILTKVELHDSIKAIAELNKMDGAYAPVRQELTGKDGDPVVPPVTVFKFANGTEFKPPRNGNKPVEAIVDGNGHGGD